MKNAVILGLLPLLKFYMRQSIIRSGKAALWNKFIIPFIAWRDIDLSTRTRQGHGISGTMKDIIFQRLYFFGVWEPSVSSYIERTLKEGDTFIDVGANVGVHTMLASTCVGASGAVHAIEASPAIFCLLKTNLVRNKLSNVIAHNVAIVDTRRTVTVYRHDDTNLGASTIMHTRTSEHPGVFVEECTIQGMPLQEAVSEAVFRSARVIKIDVEGAEIEVLRGILRHESSLREDVELIVECNPESLTEAGMDRHSFLSLLAEHRFEPLELPNTHTVRDYLGEVDLSPKALIWNVDRPVDVVFRRKAQPGPSSQAT
jgi:FkbM family methyltransferase